MRVKKALRLAVVFLFVWTLIASLPVIAVGITWLASFGSFPIMEVIENMQVVSFLFTIAGFLATVGVMDHLTDDLL
jgi:hypothetical protein